MLRSLTIAAMLAAAGCQAYQPMPLDPLAHIEALRARTTGDEQVARYAAAMAQQAQVVQAYDATDGLNLWEAEAVALFFNPRLRLARLEAGVALATAENAGQWQDPELSVEGGWILSSIAQPWFVGAEIHFTIPLSGRPGVERDLAFARHRAALREVVTQEWQVLAELRQAWRALESLREQQRLTAEYGQELDELLQRADALYQAGGISVLDRRLVEIERAARRSDLIAIGHRVQRAESEVKELLGLHPDAPLLLTVGAPQPPELPPNAEDLLLQNHVGIAKRRAEYDTAEQELRLEIRKQFPDLSIGPGYELEEGQSRISLGFGIPIPIINLNREGIARATAARLASRAAYEAELEAALHRLARALQGAAQANELLAHVQTEVAPLADQQFQDAEAMAEAGDFDALRQLEALKRRHETRLQVLEAAVGRASALDEVLVLAGPRATGADKAIEEDE